MTRPVLGIICCTRDVGDEPAQTLKNRYAIPAMRYADAAALLVPALPDLIDPLDIAPRLDGLLLTGSPSNVDPTRYGEAIDDPPGPFDWHRDEMVFRLVEAMLAQERPVFGICRGFQELNVAFGGTLRRDVSESGRMLEHHAPRETPFAEMFDHHHDIDLTPDGLLADAFQKQRLTVNSVHYQGIDRLGSGLTVEATAPDGLVEAFSGYVGKSPVLAVQWHPEWDTEHVNEYQIYFKMLGRALRGDELLGSN
jgi:putative glutamine amidotransferase